MYVGLLANALFPCVHTASDVDELHRSSREYAQVLSLDPLHNVCCIILCSDVGEGRNRVVSDRGTAWTVHCVAGNLRADTFPCPGSNG